MKWFTKRRGLAWQFAVLLVTSGILSGIFFAVMHASMEEFLFQQVNSPEFQEQATEKRITEFQQYVTIHQLSTSDGAEISRWVKKNPLLLMEIYRSNVLVFTSSAPENEAVITNDLEAPYYDWMTYYIVNFADGSADVLLYSDDGYRYKDLYESIKENGINEPVKARPRDGGGLELLSGHRRHDIAKQLNYPVPVVIVREDDDTARIEVVDGNLHRQDIPTSELARAAKMKLDALTRKAGRRSKMEQLSGPQKRSDQQVAEDLGMSRNQVQRLVRIDSLVPDLTMRRLPHRCTAADN